LSVVSVSVQPYRLALASPALRSALLLGFLVRLPVFSAGILLTVHVVSTLNGSYAAAGLLAAVATVSIAVSGPWRGRLLDRVGLRRVVAPSTAVALVCWSVAPFVGYWPLLVLAAVAGLFVIPSFSVIRQAVIAAVPVEGRRTAIALDSAAVELSFMLGPALAVWAASTWDTRWVLLGTQLLGVAGGVLLWVADPDLRHEDEAPVGTAAVPRRQWFRGPFVAVCLAAAATTLVLGGTDIAIVAAMREFDAQPSIGIVLALWGAGSLLGALLYGGLHRSVSAFWLLGALAAVTFPMALATGAGSLAALALVAGLFCAPTITATVDQASRVVPAAVRGEAMGWHGSFLTSGGAAGAPLAGAAIDAAGFRGGFVVTAAISLAVAVVGAIGAGWRRRVHAPSPAAPARG
jgi:MFS family permease